jgi:hypothetical protein
MRKLKRRKIVKEYLEAQIERNQRRIQKLSETNYELRIQLEAVTNAPVQKPLTKADLEARAKAQNEGAAEPVLNSADQEIGTPTEA